MSDRWLALAVRAQHYLVQDAQRLHAEQTDVLLATKTRLRESTQALDALHESWCSLRAESPADAQRELLFLRYRAHLDAECLTSRQQHVAAERKVEESLEHLQSLFAKRVALDRYARRREQQLQVVARRRESQEQTETWLLSRAEGAPGCK